MDIASQNENDILKALIDIMLSQIQPHFLYNSLTALISLCDSDPQKVKDYLSDFSRYLRVNLDTIKHDGPATFEKELDHVNTYLKFEKLRFEEKVKVEYDIKSLGFMIPSLTVQPIVENAVRHGLCSKEEGGTVKISSYETDNSFVVKVSDDGCGFDTSKLEYNVSDKKNTIGINNVKNRLSSIMNGTLEVVSEVGKGTVVTIKIPK